MPVISDPWIALGKHATAKQARECTELILARKGLQHLTGLESFPNLQSLWVNNNELVTLKNIRHNFRLKALYAHNNRICSLRGSLSSLRALTELDLSCNNIRDAHKVTKALMCLESLEVLNLSHNSCCEEADYRLLLIHAIPSLKVLDCHVVWESERRKARHLFGSVPEPRFAFSSTLPSALPHIPTCRKQSYHEQVANIEHRRIVKQRSLMAEALDAKIYSLDPHAPLDVSSLPPKPPGWILLPHSGRCGSDDDAVVSPTASELHRCKDNFSFYFLTKGSADEVLQFQKQPGHLPFEAELYKKHTEFKQMQRTPALRRQHTLL